MGMAISIYGNLTIGKIKILELSNPHKKLVFTSEVSGAFNFAKCY